MESRDAVMGHLSEAAVACKASATNRIIFEIRKFDRSTTFNGEVQYARQAASQSNKFSWQHTAIGEDLAKTLSS